MISVLLLHLAGRMPAGHPAQPIAQFIDHLCRFGVPLFLAAHTAALVLQGPSPEPGGRTLARRLRIVAVPYLLWSALYAGLGLLDGQWTPPHAPAAIAAEFLLGYTAEQLWYMPAYLGALLLVPLWSGLLRWEVDARTPTHATSKRLIALAAAGLGLQLAGQVWLVEVSRVDQAPPLLAGWLLRSEGRSPLHWLGFLTAGLALGSLFARGWRPPPWSRWLALPALLLHFWLALRPPQAPRFDDFWCSPAMTGGFALFLHWAWPLVALASSAKSLWLKRFYAGLAGLGRRSLPVYLGHIAWLRLAWWAVGESWPLPWALLAGLAAMVGGTWVYVPLHDRLFSPRPAAALGQSALG